ncbi:MAG TPA: ABC transporter ATP-binding protein [Streptosporangiaceae bacterium]|nr:ABC transporter ATP-binding protein [Streptosporangiaceae bacterium]
MLAGSLALVLLTVALSSVGPLLLQRVINDALPFRHVRELAILCSAMIAAGILAGAAGISQGALANRMGQRVVHNLRVELYEHIQGMELAFFAGDANTEIQARLVSDIGGISDIVTLTAQSALASLASFITACVVMLILNWPLALASIALAMALNVVNQRFSARRNALATRRQEAIAVLMRLVAEDLSLPGVILGRTLGQTGRQRARFVETSAELSAVTYQQRLAGRSAMATINMTFACLPPIIYLMSGTVVPGISLGTAVVLATMQARLTNPIQQLLSISGTLQSSRAMFDRVFTYLTLGGPRDAAQPAGTVPPGTPRLLLRAVTYRYPGAEQPALSGISLEFPPRSFTIVVGHSGSGKSTLALLAAGLLDPVRGEIRLDYPHAPGLDLTRTAVTLVPQDTALFNTSIRQNLLFARPEASAAELASALRTASLGDLLARLPEGLDTPVGERGYQLSGGERQRIALARALLSGSPVLIVDEATSSLDGLTAEEIYRQLHQISRERTVIMVAHRIPLLAADDRVIVIADGRVIEQGRHGDLVRRRGAYHKLVATQSIVAAP